MNFPFAGDVRVPAMQESDGHKAHAELCPTGTVPVQGRRRPDMDVFQRCLTRVHGINQHLDLFVTWTGGDIHTYIYICVCVCV